MRFFVSASDAFSKNGFWRRAPRAVGERSALRRFLRRRSALRRGGEAGHSRGGVGGFGI